MVLGSGQRWRPAPGVHWQPVDDEVVLLDGAGGRYLVLNATGAVLWERLADGAAVGELAGVLTETWGVGAEEAAADVARFLGDLAARGLIEPVP